jgi:hypothetical protein
MSEASAQGTQTAFRKKPVVINAVIWDGKLTTVERLGTYSGTVSQDLGAKSLQIETLEGVMTAQVGDWIIRGVKGELYPCKPDIFAATYEPALAPTPPSSEPVAWMSEYDGHTDATTDPDTVRLWSETLHRRIMPLYTHQAAGAEREALRKLVDVVWNEATESTAVPSTKWADKLIDKVFPATSLSPVRSVKKTKTTFMERLRSDAEARAALKGDSHE